MLKKWTVAVWPDPRLTISPFELPRKYFARASAVNRCRREVLKMQRRENRNETTWRTQFTVIRVGELRTIQYERARRMNEMRNG